METNEVEKKENGIQELKTAIENEIATVIQAEVSLITGNRSHAKRHLKEGELDHTVCAKATLKRIVGGLVYKSDHKNNIKFSPSKLTSILNKLGNDIFPEGKLDKFPKKDHKAIRVKVAGFLFDCAVKCDLVDLDLVRIADKTYYYPARTGDLRMNFLVREIEVAYPDQYKYGYWKEPYNNGVPIVKSMNIGESQLYSQEAMPKVYKALNALYDTQWQINHDLLAIAELGLEGFTPLAVSDEDVSTARKKVIGLKRLQPSIQEWIFGQRIADAKQPDSYEWSSPKARDRYHKKISKQLAKGVYLEKSFDLTKVISDYSQTERFKDVLFYCRNNLSNNLRFIYNLDTRGRIYSIMGGVSPQGCDLEKALLHFKEATYWNAMVEKNLSIHTANCAGEDKLDWDGRAQWTKDNMPNILKAYSSLMEKGVATEWLSQFSKDKKTKWQLIAAILVWGRKQEAEMEGTLNDFTVHIPLGLDATTSGLQILSMIGKDETVAEDVNISACSYAPVGDLYQKIGDKCAVLLRKTSFEEDDKMEKVITKLTAFRDYPALIVGSSLWRKLVKRSSMTYGYSCQAGTMGDAIFEDRKDHGDEFLDNMKFSDATNLGLLSYNAIEQSLPRTASIMKYLQKMVSNRLKKKPEGTLSWGTSTGFRAFQRYEKCVSTKMEIFIGGKRRQIVFSEWVDKAVKKDHRSGIAANFVHSLDAALLVETICHLKDRGYNSFHFIHDSYGSTMDCRNDVTECVRHSMKSMFGGDCLLEALAKDIHTEGMKEVKIPEKGTWSVDELDKAEYFFC